MDDAVAVERLPPEEAFGLLGNDTRIAVMRALWEADGPLPFLGLRERADVDRARLRRSSHRRSRREREGILKSREPVVAYMQHVKIPQDRIGVLIGDGGETMRRIEDEADVRLDIDSENGSVAVEQVGDPIRGMQGPDVVRAIGRGFKPDDALELLEDEMMMFDVIDVSRAARNDNDLRRKKGRLIGENGRTRELMEELTGANVVIYGSTMGLIGRPKEVDIARSAAEMLLDGAPHGTVYSFLERKRTEELKHQGMEYHEYAGQ